MSSQAGKKMSEIASVLSGAAAKWQKRHGGEMPPGACLHEAVEARTPFDELAEKEERDGVREPGQEPLFAGLGEHRTPFDELAEKDAEVQAESEEAMRIWLEANAWFLDFLFAEGPHPATVMRRLYAWVKKFRPQSIWDMGYRQIGTLLCESHGAMEWRIGQLLDDYAKAKGVNGVKAPWQRTAEACSHYAAAQMGNGNRNGGKKSAKGKLLANGAKGRSTNHTNHTKN